MTKIKGWHIAGLFVGIFVVYELTKTYYFNARRPMIFFASEQYQYPMRIVEIGVFYGQNAKRMFDNLNIEVMYLVDPYKKYKDYEREKFIFPFLPPDFGDALMNLQEYADRIVPLQMTSEEAAAYIPNDLDMVYIDGNHSYEYTKRDIEVYAPKIKKGGLIGGHDIMGNLLSLDVQRAVFEFADRHGYDVYVEKPDWWIVL